MLNLATETSQRLDDWISSVNEELSNPERGAEDLPEYWSVDKYGNLYVGWNQPITKCETVDLIEMNKEQIKRDICSGRLNFNAPRETKDK